MRPGASRRATAASAALAAMVAPAFAWWLAAPPLRDVVAAGVLRGGASQVGVEAALQGLCSVALLVCTAWLAAATCLAVAAEVWVAVAPGSRSAGVARRVSERSCPRAVRRMVALALGAVLAAAAAAGPAAAHPGPRPVPRTDLTGLPLPDRTTGADLAATAPRTALRPVVAARVGRAVDPATVVVRPGDSLWSIAAQLLPRGTADAGVTAAWHRLHRANASRIGPDPDLIHPGTRLRVPDLTAPPREDAR